MKLIDLNPNGLIKIGLLLAGIFPLSYSLRAQPPKDKGYVLLFDESFNGTQLNENDWKYREGKKMTGLSRKENVFVSNGSLHIALRQETINGKPENTGGGVISKHQFGYGYYECRSKPFTKGGVHSSFWQSEGVIPNNNIFEIDSYEIYGDNLMGNNNFYLHLKPRDYQYAPYPYHSVIPFTVDKDGWFLDAYEYTPEGVIFYDNGKEVARSDWGELTAAQCIWLTALNLRVKKNEFLPSVGLIDHFRYYAKDYPGKNILPNGDFEYNSGKIDRNVPVAWQQSGTSGACTVVDGGASRNISKLRLVSGDSPYEKEVFQNLEFIMNGEYTLSAMVRSSGGQKKALIKVSDFGGKDLSVDVPQAKEWVRIEIPKISVSNHQVRISIATTAAAGQWMEIDNIQFMKPLPAGIKAEAEVPFKVVRDPFWSTAEKYPVQCEGNGMIIGLSPNIGTGNKLSIDLTLTAKRKDDMSVFAKLPQSGISGRGIYLTKEGDVVFRIGSRSDYTDIVAPKAYSAGKPCKITCVYNDGSGMLYIDSKLIKQVKGIRQNTDAGGGRFGDVMNVFSAVGDKTGPKYAEFSGTIQDIKFYNRALDAEEIKM